jgi:hypothetical protein
LRARGVRVDERVGDGKHEHRQPSGGYPYLCQGDPPLSDP